MKKSELLPADLLALHMKMHGLKPTAEFRFHPVRRWRFDFAFKPEKLAVEVEGGIWVRGRHTRGKGFESDCEKYALALIDGWRVLRVTGKQIESGQAITWVRFLLET